MLTRAILNYRGLSSSRRETHFDEVFMIVRVAQTEDGNSIDVTRIEKYYIDTV